MIGFPITYGDKLTLEESSKPIKSASKVSIKGFAKGFKTGILVYGTSKIFSRSVFAADSLKIPNNNNPAWAAANLQKPVKVSDAQFGALAASCGTICTVVAISESFWVGFASSLTDFINL